MVAGLYKIYWEEEASTTCLISEITINRNIESESEFEGEVAKFLPTFDCFSGNSSIGYELLYAKNYKNRQIAIVNYSNEIEINNLIEEGYKIREFVIDKCILELKSKRI